MIDGGRMGLRRHTVHGLVEFDVTKARDLIRGHELQTGERLSFSAFFLACLGKAVDMNKTIQAYRGSRKQLIVFDELDVNMLFEVEVDGRKTIRPRILRAVNDKSFLEIHQEIRAFQREHKRSQESKFIEWFVLLPGFVRRLFLRWLFKNPLRIKKYYGTVLVSSVGMFGTGGGWGIPVANHTLQLTLGGIAKKPGFFQDRIEAREYLSITISIDHDIVDGAPAARFVQQLRELIESGYGLAGTTGQMTSCETPRWTDVASGESIYDFERGVGAKE